jgi:hypothetical protein
VSHAALPMYGSALTSLGTHVWPRHCALMTMPGDPANDHASEVDRARRGQGAWPAAIVAIFGVLGLLAIVAFVHS